jgi:hypothetical protein
MPVRNLSHARRAGFPGESSAAINPQFTDVADLRHCMNHLELLVGKQTPEFSPGFMRHPNGQK